jgi:hypothetical protein
VKESLDKLTSPPDLLLIHAPTVPDKGKIGEFWTILESLVEDGTLKGTSLGVSNFRPQDLEDVLKVAKIKPVVNRESTFLPRRTLSNKRVRSSMTHAPWLGATADPRQKWSTTRTSSPTPSRSWTFTNNTTS